MSNEIRVTTSLTVVDKFQSVNSSFQADMGGGAGPTPGDILVATTGTDVSLAQLTAMGGVCYLRNNDNTNYVTYGVWTGAVFTPLGELLPGERYTLRLARTLLTGWTGTANVNTLRFYANTAACRVFVGAFDK